MARFPRLRRAVVDTLEQRQLLAGSNLITNGDFSGNSLGWATTGNFAANQKYGSYRTGPGYAYLAGSDGTLTTSNNLVGTLKQTVTVPANATSANLSFWYRTASSEGSAQLDSLLIRIRDTSGALLGTVTTLYNQATMAAYVKSANFNLLPYAGQTIVLSFEGQTNATNGTVFRVDDVSIITNTPNTAPSTVATPTLVSPGIVGTTGLPTVNAPSPTLLWNAVPNSTGYGVKVEQLSGSTWSTIYDTEIVFGKIKGTSLTLPLSLTAGTYRWSVRSYDSAGNVSAYAPALSLNVATTGYNRAIGIDVSHWQTVSNWSAVKTNTADGTNAPRDPNATLDDVSFAWTKATQDTYYHDPTLASHMNGARAAGVAIGAYHFPEPEGTTTAAVIADAKAEALYFYNSISPYLLAGNLVPMLDMENDVDNLAYNMGKTLSTVFANAWCDELHALSGLTPVIYTYTSFAVSYLDSTLLRYPLWMASYPDGKTSTPPTTDTRIQTSAPSATPWTTWSFWQYGSTGTSAGISSNGLDRDVFNGDVAALDGFRIQPTTVYSVTGTLFEDTNNNGVRDAGEAGLSGRTVFLDADGDGLLGATERSTTTNASGAYTFAGLLQGNYNVRQIVPGTSNATGVATQSFKLAVGVTNVAHDFGSKVIDTTPPTLASSNFAFATSTRPISLVFSDDIASTLINSDAVLTNLTTGLIVPTTMLYTAATKTAVFTPLAGEFTNGNYKLVIGAGTIADAAGNTNAEAKVELFWLAGDANRDRNVNFDDLVPLAQNYNTNGDYAAGDLTGDGVINFDDLVVLSQNYNASVAEIIVTPPAVVAMIAPVTATKATATTKATPKKRAADDVLA